jgi:hypothetical protein
MASLTRTCAVLIAASLVSASCGADESSPTVTAPPAPSTGAPPTGAPLGTITLTSGVADVSLTGGLEADASFDVLSAPAVYQPPPGSVAVAWGQGGLVITGPLNLGAQATIGGLTLSLSVPTEGLPVDFSSSAGECVITVEAATDRAFSGSFACDGLAGGGVIADAEGTFEASG